MNSIEKKYLYVNEPSSNDLNAYVPKRHVLFDTSIFDKWTETLNPNVFENDLLTAQRDNQITNLNQTTGFALVSTHPEFLKCHLKIMYHQYKNMHAPFIKEECVYLGYYYQPNQNSHLIDELAINLKPHATIYQITQTLIDQSLITIDELIDQLKIPYFQAIFMKTANQKAKPSLIDFRLTDSQIILLIDLLKQHHSGMVKINYPTYQKLMHRINENEKDD